MGLTPEQAAKNIRETPHGCGAFYDTTRGEIVKRDGWQAPDFRSLIKVAQTEQGRSEVSCVLEHVQGVTMAKPMIFTDDTYPTHYTFANQVKVQTNKDAQAVAPVYDELSRTIESHLWLANLEMSSGITPTMSTTSKMPREPHPQGPIEMTWTQLAHEQIALEEAHAAHDVSRMLRGVVSNMHLLAKLSREAGFTPYACCLKSQINSNRPPSDCDLGSVWSLQVDLDKDMPKACALAMEPSL